MGVENNTDDFPQRLQYLTNSPAPQAYDIGFFNGGNWLNYTRKFPSGLYNIFVRAADGSTSGALGNVGISQVTNEWGYERADHDQPGDVQHPCNWRMANLRLGAVERFERQSG